MNTAELSAFFNGTDIPRIVTSIEDMRDHDYLVTKNGLMAKISNPIGDFYVVTNKFEHSSIAEDFNLDPVFSGLKIPGKYFYGVLRFYFKMWKIMKNEVMAEFFYNKITGEWRIVVPEQEVSGASITYHKTGECYTDPNWFRFSTSHSHHTMGAFFSGVDDADEKKLNCQYAFVIGGMKVKGEELESYSTVQRIRIGDKFVTLQLDDIFDFSEPGHENAWDVPEEDYANVKEKKFTSSYHTGAAPRSYPYNYGSGYSPYGKDYGTAKNTAANKNYAVDVSAYQYDDYGYDDWDFGKHLSSDPTRPKDLSPIDYDHSQIFEYGGLKLGLDDYDIRSIHDVVSASQGIGIIEKESFLNHLYGERSENISKAISLIAYHLSEYSNGYHDQETYEDAKTFLKGMLAARSSNFFTTSLSESALVGMLTMAGNARKDKEEPLLAVKTLCDYLGWTGEI